MAEAKEEIFKISWEDEGVRAAIIIIIIITELYTDKKENHTWNRSAASLCGQEAHGVIRLHIWSSYVCHD